jgi:ribosomal protein S18 acetylase RimI-like enzyme
LPPNFQIRRATENDVDGVLDLLEAVAAEGRWIATEPPIDRVRRGAGMLATIRHEDAVLFVAVCDNAIVGELGLYPGWPGVYDLAMLVERSQRGNGIGTALISVGIEYAKQKHAHKISLEVFPWNTGAVALYTKFGFLHEGYRRRHLRRKNGEQWDVIAMGLLLGRYDPPAEDAYSVGDVQIRIARRGDREALARLRHALWPEATYDELLSDTDKIFDGVASSLPLVDFVAQEGARVVGFVEVGLRSHANHCDPTLPTGFIEGWFVEAATRRRGIGRALIGAAEEWARRQGCKEMASDALVDNELSQLAHERLGFEVANRCTDFRKAL